MIVDTRLYYPHVLQGEMETISAAFRLRNEVILSAPVDMKK
jgi:hypothetical protein